MVDLLELRTQRCDNLPVSTQVVVDRVFRFGGECTHIDGKCFRTCVQLEEWSRICCGEQCGQRHTLPGSPCLRGKEAKPRGVSCARSPTTGPMTVSTPSCVGVPSLSSNLKSERTTVNVPSYALQLLQNMRHHRICHVNDPRRGRECLWMVSA